MSIAKDGHKRTIVKTVAWRVIATCTTMAVVYIFTKKLVLSLGVGAVEAGIKTLLYYLHERTWNQIAWGRKKLSS